MRISDWSSDVCSSDLITHRLAEQRAGRDARQRLLQRASGQPDRRRTDRRAKDVEHPHRHLETLALLADQRIGGDTAIGKGHAGGRMLRDELDLVTESEDRCGGVDQKRRQRSVEHTSEIPSLMRISYAVSALKKNNKRHSFIHLSITI